MNFQKKKVFALLILFFLSVTSQSYANSQWKVSQIGSDWEWLEDYAWASAKYTLICKDGFVCEVGTGVFFLDIPLGGIGKFSGKKEVPVYGFGAIHARIVGKNENGEIAMYLGEKENISIIDIPW